MLDLTDDDLDKIGMSMGEKKILKNQIATLKTVASLFLGNVGRVSYKFQNEGILTQSSSMKELCPQQLAQTPQGGMLCI